MATSKTMRALFLEHVAQTSDNPLMVEVAKAEGIYLYGPDGKRYVDLISGVSVSNVGHGNPAVVDAVCSQARDYMHLMVYGEMIESPQVRLAQKLASLLPPPLDNVYFVNSGSEANEGALKLAKRHTGRTNIVYFKNAYHGSTHGALSVMGGEEYRNAFRPLLPDTTRIRFNRPDDLAHITPRTAAVIVEPVQGEGGIIPPAPGFLEALRKRCDETGALLIFDEIQTGIGRTGEMFALAKYSVTPDILTLAKALGGGMPLGAFIASTEIMSSFKSNPALGHITTFGGHPVCCAAGLAAIEFLENEGLVPQVETKGALFEKLLNGHPLVKEIRRSGLMMAIEFGDATIREKAMSAALDRGILLDFFLFCDTAFRIAPPLTSVEAEIRAVCRELLLLMDTLK